MSTKNFINIKHKNDRIVVLVDMDCFYCQVEENLNPELRGKPIAVVQYNPFQGGGIIAVNYPAREKGVKRGMRGDDARKLCPDIELPQVPCVRGKADISKYRDAGKLVADVLQTFTPLLERASIDEAYLDISQKVSERLSEMHEGKFKITPNRLENTFVVGYNHIGDYVQQISANINKQDSEDSLESEEDRSMYKKSDLKLLIGATIVNEIRAAVKFKTSYECSAGIAHNKILAKLTAGFHKPNKQTVLPLKNIPTLYETLSLKKVKGLGGKLGDQLCQSLNVQTMGELLNFNEQTLQKHSDERMGSWLYLMARGIDLEAVTPKYNAKSIGCCKRFPGKNAITGLTSLKHWLGELAKEVCERLNKEHMENNRTAKNIVVSYAQQINQEDISSTRTFPLIAYDDEKIAKDALDAIRRNTEPFLRGEGNLFYPVKFLGISASKFDEGIDKNASRKNNIKDLFSNLVKKKTEEEENGQTSKGHALQEQNGETLKKTENETKNEEKSFFINHFKKLKENQDPPDKKEEVRPQNDPYDDDTLELPYEENDKPSTSTSVPEYLKSYAEFYRPPVTAKVKCDECEQMILENEIDSHKDFHVALDVSRQQREEFRQEMKKEKSTSSHENSKTDIIKLFKNYTKKPEETPQENCEEEVAEPQNKENDNSDNPVEETCENSNDSKIGEANEEDQEPEIDESLLVSLTPPENLLTCPECGKKLPESQLQSHLDFHMAFKLSQQQREEFRLEIKGKIQTQHHSQSPVQKAKSKIKTKSHQSLAKFLIKTEESESLDTHQKCNECGRNVPIDEFAEHVDYHAAKKLQIELNKQEMKTVTSNNFNVSNNNNKRKRPTTKASSETLSPAQKIKSVSSYFSKN